jgi:tRNA(fMet)-specific endonuclease VapC
VIHLDTSFVVDLLRDRHRHRLGPASAYLESLDKDEDLAVSVHMVSELMAGACAQGAPREEAARVERLCDALLVRYPDSRFAPAYGRLLLASLNAAGVSVHAMDLLIATAAVLDDAPLVTRNARHFAKVPGLRLEAY